MSGRIGNVDLAASTITDVYEVPASTMASININVCNRNAAPAYIRLAISDVAGVQDNDEYIEYDAEVPANGVLERTGYVLSAGQIVTAYSDTANITVTVVGIEEAI